MGFRVSFGDEPAATGVVIPPLFLHSEHILAHVEIVQPGFTVGLVRRRTSGGFAAEAKFADVARAAVGTG